MLFLRIKYKLSDRFLKIFLNNAQLMTKKLHNILMQMR